MTKTLTINHDRQINHYLTLQKGDSITFTYRGVGLDKKERVHSWEGVASHNHNVMYSKKKDEQYIMNLFEMSDIDTSEAYSFDDYFELLEELFTTPSIAHVNIYNKDAEEEESILPHSMFAFGVNSTTEAESLIENIQWDNYEDEDGLFSVESVMYNKCLWMYEAKASEKETHLNDLTRYALLMSDVALKAELERAVPDWDELSEFFSELNQLGKKGMSYVSYSDYQSSNKNMLTTVKAKNFAFIPAIEESTSLGYIAVKALTLKDALTVIENSEYKDKVVVSTLPVEILKRTKDAIDSFSNVSAAYKISFLNSSNKIEKEIVSEDELFDKAWAIRGDDEANGIEYDYSDEATNISRVNLENGGVDVAEDMLREYMGYEVLKSRSEEEISKNKIKQVEQSVLQAIEKGVANGIFEPRGEEHLNILKEAMSIIETDETHSVEEIVKTALHSEVKTAQSTYSASIKESVELIEALCEKLAYSDELPNEKLSSMLGYLERGSFSIAASLVKELLEDNPVVSKEVKSNLIRVKMAATSCLENDDKKLAISASTFDVLKTVFYGGNEVIATFPSQKKAKELKEAHELKYGKDLYTSVSVVPTPIKR